MKYNPKIHRRQSNRLKGYDYSQPGYYFVTINTKYKDCHFGKIGNGIMNLSNTGKIAYDCWMAIPDHYPNTKLDAFVIMPNHVHGIIHIMGDGWNEEMELGLVKLVSEGAQNFVPLRATFNKNTNQFQKIIPRSFGSIIRGYKIGVIKEIKKWNPNSIWAGWQRNFDDQIIRDQNHLIRARKYIKHNPGNWGNDRNNLKNSLQ